MYTSFFGGFLIGIIFRNKFLNFSKCVITNCVYLYHILNKKVVITRKKIQSVHFVCAINNMELFTQQFPEQIVQPHWEYYRIKKVIKIELDEDVINYLNVTDLALSFDNIVMLSTIDKDFFKEFGELFFYIKYNLDNVPFINVYT